MISAEALFRIGDAAEDAGDFELARRSFESGAALDDEACLSRLAYIFDIGAGVAPDKRRAMRLYLRAWRLGSHSAGNNIAILFRESGNSRGVVRWFQRAAERGDDGARIELAKLYLSGSGVEHSPGKAVRLLAQAKSGGVLSECEIEEADALLASLRPKLASTNSG